MKLLNSVSNPPLQKKVNSISFKGNPPLKLSSGLLEKGVTAIAGSSSMESLVKNLKYDKLTKHMPALVSGVLTGFYLLMTKMNTKIEEKRKSTLMLNMVMVAGFATACGYTINGMIKGSLDKFSKGVGVAAAELKGVPVKKLLKGVNAAVPLIVFTIMYRFVGPVLASPTASAITKKFQPKAETKGHEFKS